MRTALRQGSNPRGRIAQVYSSPSPVAGWNARDAIANMMPGDAVVMDNVFPLTTECMVRKGSSAWATGITGTVETVASYNRLNGLQSLFAAAGSNIYDVTISGAVGAAVQTGLTNARWQHTNFGTAGGKYLYMVNGADKPRLWDGAAWVAVDGASVPAITGVTTTGLIGVAAHKSRLWFIEKDTTKVWYLPTLSIGGAATAFDLASVFRMGGYLMAMGTWTIDAGYGMDDHAVFVSSEGEVAVYKGTDPSSAASWALVGVYFVGRPMSRRCLTQYGSDLLVICKDGLVPLSKALLSSRVNTGVALTDRIQTAVSEATTNYGSSYGWEAVVYPVDNLLLLNVPVTGTAQEQYVMNTITGAWCKYTGLAASCWELSGDALFFGTSGAVWMAQTGHADNGNNIDWKCLAAFQQHGGATLKHYVEARPILSSSVPNLGVQLGLNVDYDLTEPTGSPTFSAVAVEGWDTGTWDSALWFGSGSGVQTLRRDWQTVGAIGYSGALYIKGASKNADVRWQSVDYVFQAGYGVI